MEELKEITAKLYGLPFYQSGLSLDSKDICNIDFYNNIINIHGEYSAKDIEGFNLELPNYKSRN